MSREDALWDLLERSDWPGQAPGLVTCQDAEVWDPGTCHWLEGLGVIREVSAAELAACPECLDVHIERIRYSRLPGGALVTSIPCPACGEVRFSTDVLRRWQIDIPAFAAALSRHCLRTNAREVIHQRCWSLGAENGKPVFLLRGVLWPDAAATFAAKHAFPRESRLLYLTRLAPAFKLGAGEWFPIWQVFRPAGWRLEFDSEADSNGPEHEMRPAGRFWTLTFKARTGSVPHGLGLIYVRTILSAPGRNFSALELASPTSGADLSVRQAAGDEGLTVSDGSSSEETIDDEYRVQVQSRISQLSALKSMRGLRPEEAQELDELRRHLQVATNVRGRPRKMPREGENARVAVSRAIACALKEISIVLPEMADHLRAHIKTGSFFSYEGDGVVFWSLPDASVTSRVTK